MKKIYEIPAIEISLFETKDVITGSGGNPGNNTPSVTMTNAGVLPDDYSDGSYSSIFGA